MLLLLKRDFFSMDRFSPQTSPTTYSVAELFGATTRLSLFIIPKRTNFSLNKIKIRRKIPFRSVAHSSEMTLKFFSIVDWNFFILLCRLPKFIIKALVHLWKTVNKPSAGGNAMEVGKKERDTFLALCRRVSSSWTEAKSETKMMMRAIQFGPRAFFLLHLVCC